IGPLGLRTTARSQAPAVRAAPTVIAQRCDLAKACFTSPDHTHSLRMRDQSEATYCAGQSFFLQIQGFKSAAASRDRLTSCAPATHRAAPASRAAWSCPADP